MNDTCRVGTLDEPPGNALACDATGVQ